MVADSIDPPEKDATDLVVNAICCVHGTQDPCTSETTAFALGRNNGGENVINQKMAVRRLTPTEYERLMGFPDGYTTIPWCKKPADECPDGPRYKALGNSWAVPVVRWIGNRIAKQMAKQSPKPRGEAND